MLISINSCHWKKTMSWNQSFISQRQLLVPWCFAWQPYCYLPKFTIFGKYVRLSVCYLPKFTILASMFVCRFVTCQNLQFLASMFVCRFVCLSVSLSVLSSITHERFDISSPNLVHKWNGWAVPVCDIDKQVGHRTRSPGKKIGQIFKSPQFRQFLSYKFDQ